MQRPLKFVSKSFTTLPGGDYWGVFGGPTLSVQRVLGWAVRHLEDNQADEVAAYAVPIFAVAEDCQGEDMNGENGLLGVWHRDELPDELFDYRGPEVCAKELERRRVERLAAKGS